MNLRKISLIYLSSYLGFGGLGFAIFPNVTLHLFYSNIAYDPVVVQFMGLFMCLLSFLIYNIYRFQDWKYYLVTIRARIPAVIFIFYLYYISNNPMFLIINGIVIIGLALTIIGYFKSKN